ncbi:MAG: IS110 family transposase [Pseudonocardiaceae bacterium]
MDEMVEFCAGLDVHRDTVVATVRKPRVGGRASMTLTFPTTALGLAALGDWLVRERVTLAGMESTGVYWKPVFFALEDRVEQVWLLNAEHLHNVPGRKTDVGDSLWIAQLLEHGLVRPSFVPPAPIRELRDLTRHRRTLIEERTRVIQRLEKVLQDAGIKLSSVASTVLTKSGRAILDALLAGVQDPVELAELAKGRLRSKIPALRQALRGQFRVEHHGILVAQMLAHVDFLDEALVELDGRIAAVMVPFEPVVERVVTIPGVARRTAVSLVAEIGVDMAVFPTPGQLASWAGVCPGNNASGGKRRPARTRHGSPWLKTALTEAAQAAARTKGTYLAAHHAAVRGRRGTHKAIGATRHDILIAYWHIVAGGVEYRELGADWAARRDSRQHEIDRLLRRLNHLAHTVGEPAAATA